MSRIAARPVVITVMSQSHRLLRAVSVVACFAVLSIVVLSVWEIPRRQQNPSHISLRKEKALVVASMKHENTSWVHEHFENWLSYIYVVDEPTATLTVSRNKGREANVYLS